MGWGTAGNIVTTALDAAGDDPSAARAHLKAALDEITAIINGRASASGVASLDSDTLVPAAQLPNELNSSSGQPLTLDPATGIVIIEDVLKLNAITESAAKALSGLADGMIVMLSDGDSTIAAPAYYSAGEWRRFTDNSII